MVLVIKKRVRRHGCQCPWNCQQVLSYFVYLANCSSFYLIELLCFYSSEYEHQAVLMAIVYSILAILTAYYTLMATLIDPTDEIVYLQSECTKKKVSFHSSKFSYHCILCDSNVMAGSKHCGACNRCASGFDHHCIMLNNCVGDKNYKQFIQAINWTTWFCLINFVNSGLCVYDLSAKGDAMHRIEDKFR